MTNNSTLRLNYSFIVCIFVKKLRDMAFRDEVEALGKRLRL